ncbi:protein Flattop, partial [Catharus ustulatus]|uniref:protein Flattop n=1 Tax=Catharus ustulatus TaxID=91951 RepID=UPI00140762E2
MAGQDAFSPPRLQCWTVPRPPQKVSPWGTFLGTWDMPRSIPPAWLDLSTRSPRAAQRVLESQPQTLLRACNGICTRVTGQVTLGTHLGTLGTHLGTAGLELGTHPGHTQSQPQTLLRACNGICTRVTGQVTLGTHLGTAGT